MLTLDGLVTFVVYVIVGGLVFWLLNYLLDYCGVPEPFLKIGKVAVAVIAVLFLIGALLALVGRPLLVLH